MRCATRSGDGRPYSAPTTASASPLCAACLLFAFIIPQQVWQVATYRAGRDNDMVQMLNDQAWFVHLGVAGTAMVQLVALAICILRDDRDEPLVPRWVAYVCMHLTLGVVSGGLIVFTETGPIAWDGIIVWWIVAASSSSSGSPR